MRPSFLARLVNGPLFDPVVFIRLLNRNTSLLFDCGRIGNLSNREILSIDSIFISHPHMDHFMGFDHVLRVILHRERPLNLYGPEGIADKVISKLNSYTWNLAGDYPLEVMIHEVRDHDILTRSARAGDAFKPSMPSSSPRRGATIATNLFYSVDASVLDHHMPCLGFVLKEPFHININAARIAELGYTRGPWIGELKGLIFAECMDDYIDVPAITGNRRIKVHELFMELVITSAGQKIGYFTDIRASGDNLKRIRELAGNMDILFIEAYYLAEREQQAHEKAHLTAREAGLIAGMVKARKVVPMHISPRYHDRIDEVMGELTAARISC